MGNILTPEELGRDLRQGESVSLRRRRRIVGLSFFSCAVLGTVALYQIGLLKKLPEPRWRIFNSRKVNGSGEAYSIAATPDALLGMASYAVTACLAGTGPENRSLTHPWIPVGLALKLLADSALAAKLTVDECAKYNAFSLWSVLAAAATWTAFPLAVPDAVEAVRHLSKGQRNA